MMITPREETPQQAFKRACEHLGIDYNTPASHLNAGQLFMLGWFAKGGMPQQEDSKYLFGLNGICAEFGVSKKTACFWAGDWMKPAVERRGKTIIVDKELAHKLFDEREGRK